MTIDPFPPFRLDRRVAIVTGASSGLGARFARVLAGAGATVVLAARRADRLADLVAQLPGATAVPTDMRDDTAIDELVATTVERHGRIDVLVNNAGITENTPALDERPERFREVLETNLTGPFLLARACAREMLRAGAGGSVINIASINAILASRSSPEPSYAASKGGLLNLTRELAYQWAGQGVRVNAIGPGYFETEMTAGLFSDDRGPGWVARHTPMGRHGREDELDGALLFLASDASSYVTGQMILVDGGWSVV